MHITRMILKMTPTLAGRPDQIARKNYDDSAPTEENRQGTTETVANTLTSRLIQITQSQ